jgi:hypothetical protein
MSKAQRLSTLQVAIEKEYISAARKAGNEVYQASKISISNTYYRQVFATEFIVEPSVNYVLNILNPAVIDVSVYGTPEVWANIKQQAIDKIEKSFGELKKYQPQYGTLTDILLKNKAKDLQAIKQAVNNSLITGQSYARATEALNKVIETSKSDIMRIIRTESNRNMNAGNMAMTNNTRSQGLDIRRMWVSTLDSRTRADHASFDGVIENEEGYFIARGLQTTAPGYFGIASEDVNCRCTTIDLVDGEVPTMRRGIDPVTGESDIISYKNFDTWATENNLVYKKGLWEVKK